jgi:hypothetical protein
VRVPVDDAGTAQVWGSKDPWWLQYETPEGLPQRATLTNASWRTPGTGTGTVTERPDEVPIGPGAGSSSSSGSTGGSGSTGSTPGGEAMVPTGPDRVDQLPTSTGTPPGPGPQADPPAGGSGTGGSATPPSGTTPKPAKKKKGWTAKKK